MTTDHLFVFGTLLSGYDHPMSRLLSQTAQLVGEAHCRARLYLVRHYPGMVLSDEGTDRVFGELYRMPNDGGELLLKLDAYERCRPTDPQPHEYVRERIAVTLTGGPSIEALTYLYDRPVTHLPRIASGRFLEHVAGMNGQ